MSSATSISRRFPLLSIRDLLDAREAYHVHLSRFATVIGTAIGRYRELKHDKKSVNPADWESKEEQPPRMFSNSRVTDESWPCILVLVNRWYTRKELTLGNNLDLLVPPRLYLPDGRAVPTCVMYVKQDAKPPEPLRNLNFPSGLIGGGYPVLTEVQGEERVGSLGCLVSDGDYVYALTNLHVTGEAREGEAGRPVYTICSGQQAVIGTGDAKQRGKMSFAELYRGWPGERVFANLDAGLIRVADLRHWTSQVYGLGELGELVDLHQQTITLDLIGRPVHAVGGASGRMVGEIQGFFYRYKSVGGFDYVADLLIGASPGDTVRTRPGDSGTLWCVDVDDEKEDHRARGKRKGTATATAPASTAAAGPGTGGGNPLLRPLALQWGGHTLIDPAGGGESVVQLALGTFLSTICRVLDVELVRDHNIGHSEYWGKLGHFKVAARACELVSDSKLKKLMVANIARIAYGDEVLKGKLPTFPNPQAQFVPLSDVPDLVWRTTRKMDRASHFADMDQKGTGTFAGKTLLELCKKASNVDARVFAAFYDSIGVKAVKDRGSLPFRVWQMYDEMVTWVRQGSVSKFVAVAGIMAHYAGDACQPLHISQFHDGRKPEEKGVHSAYETNMLDGNRAAAVDGVNNATSGFKARPKVEGGHGAAVATVLLMRETYNALSPEDIIDAYNAAKGAKAMWGPLGGRTVDCLARGAKNLAMLWESAWEEGGGKKIAATKLTAVPTKTLIKLYNDKSFSKAMWLDDLIEAGVGVLDGASPDA